MTMPAEMAEPAISMAAVTARKMSLVLLLVGGDDEVGLSMIGASDRLEELPGSEGPILPKSMVRS